MAKYLLLFTGEAKMPETDEEKASVMGAWEAWFGKLGAKLSDPGNPTSGQAKTIDPDGVVSTTPSEWMASGYSVITADSLEEAVEMAKGCPVLAGGSHVTVYETFDIM